MATVKSAIGTLSMPPETKFSTIPPAIDAQLGKLHALSRAQEDAIPAAEIQHVRALAATDPAQGHALLDALMADKFVALDRDKSLLVHQLALARGATRAVEVGTSFGVSTIYLALAVRANAARLGGTAGVIATEKEVEKAKEARRHWAEAGDVVEGAIDLRVGDLEETLKTGVQDVDFVLLDVWPHVALPALKLLLPHLKPGATVVTDNVISSGERYASLLSVLRDPEGPFTSVCLPYEGGMELSVFKGR